MKLYALCDKRVLKNMNISLSEFINISKKYDAQIIQYRNKDGNIDEVEQDLIAIRKIWDKTLILNDYLNFQNIVDGYHIGQEDLKKYGSIENIREKIGRKILGLSTHNREEISEANSFDLDYIGLGAYRNTNTKEVSTVLGNQVEELSKLSKHDVAIIGGVKLNDQFENAKFLVIGSGLL